MKTPDEDHSGSLFFIGVVIFLLLWLVLSCGDDYEELCAGPGCSQGPREEDAEEAPRDPDTSPVPGPTSPAGEPQSAGPMGSPGKDGQDGAPGSSGLPGSPGPVGKDGVSGPQGPLGPAGEAGEDAPPCTVTCISRKKAKLSCPDGTFVVLSNVESCL